MEFLLASLGLKSNHCRQKNRGFTCNTGVDFFVNLGKGVGNQKN